mmetsp:Transcript_87591/g.261258  ORF Transcript_87591/g.261258 Transcript_87591/m.261258 type:complete len:330 (-) Transcript_87591:50-1039(-)
MPAAVAGPLPPQASVRLAACSPERMVGGPAAVLEVSLLSAKTAAPHGAGGERTEASSTISTLSQVDFEALRSNGSSTLAAVPRCQASGSAVAQQQQQQQQQQQPQCILQSPPASRASGTSSPLVPGGPVHRSSIPSGRSVRILAAPRPSSRPPGAAPWQSGTSSPPRPLQRAGRAPAGTGAMSPPFPGMPLAHSPSRPRPLGLQGSQVARPMVQPPPGAQACAYPALARAHSLGRPGLVLSSPQPPSPPSAVLPQRPTQVIPGGQSPPPPGAVLTSPRRAQAAPAAPPTTSVAALGLGGRIQRTGSQSVPLPPPAAGAPLPSPRVPQPA